MAASDRSAAPPNGWKEIPGSWRTPPLRAQPTEKDVDPDEKTQVTVLLAPDPNLQGRRDLLLAHDQGLTAPGRREPYATREDVIAANRPPAGSVEAVTAHARKHNLEVVGELPPWMLVLEGRFQDAADAFKANYGRQLYVENFSFEEGATPSSKEFHERTGPLYMPEELDGIVKGVTGLDTRSNSQIQMHIQMHADVRVVDIQMHADVAIGVGRDEVQGEAAYSFTPRNLARYYEFPKATGQNQVIAILSLNGAADLNSLARYFEFLGQPLPAITQVVVAGRPNKLGDVPAADRENQLDAVMLSVASGARLVYYFAENSARGYLQALAAAVYDTVHRPDIITTSWTAPEAEWTPQTMEAITWVLRDAASLGVTVCVASGDYGAYGRPPAAGEGAAPPPMEVQFPASSGWALACGGTELVLPNGWLQKLAELVNGVAPGPIRRWTEERAAKSALRGATEVAWNDAGRFATGGGVSGFFSRPKWQDESRVTWSDRSVVQPPTGRAIPDLAANAGPGAGYLLYVPDESRPQMVAGGTSAAAPLYAGLIALINEKLGKNAGYFLPYLYQAVGNGPAFVDITSGDNFGYAAVERWDACTGFGRARGNALLELLR